LVPASVSAVAPEPVASGQRCRLHRRFGVVRGTPGQLDYIERRVRGHDPARGHREPRGSGSEKCGPQVSAPHRTSHSHSQNRSLMRVPSDLSARPDCRTRRICRGVAAETRQSPHRRQPWPGDDASASQPRARFRLPHSTWFSPIGWLVDAPCFGCWLRILRWSRASRCAALQRFLEPFTLRESFRPKPEFQRLCSKRTTTTDG